MQFLAHLAFLVAITGTSLFQDQVLALPIDASTALSASESTYVVRSVDAAVLAAPAKRSSTLSKRGKDKSESHKALNYFSGGYDAQAGRAEREAEEKNKKKFAQQHQGTLQKLAGEKPLVGGSSEKKKSHSSKKKGAAGKQKQESEGEESDEEPKKHMDYGLEDPWKED